MDLPLLALLFPGLFAVVALGWIVRWVRWAPSALRSDPLRNGGEPVYGTVLSSTPPGRGAAGPTVAVRAESADGRRTWEAVDDSGLGGYDPAPGTRVEGVYAPGDPSRLRVLRIARADGEEGFGVRAGSGGRALRIAGGVLGALVVSAAAAIAWSAPSGAVSPFGLVFLVVPAAIALVGLNTAFAGLPGLVRLLSGLYRGRVLEAQGTVTDAWTETRTRSSGAGGGSDRYLVHALTVRFTTADGRRVHARDPVDRLFGGPAVGDPVRVRHVESDPTLFATGTLAPLNIVFGKGLRLVLGPVLVVVGLSLLAGFL
ncbi:hypothetical protein [Nocardiopsis flavescens]